MFENAEVGNKVDRETYNREAPEVRSALLEAQRELAGADFSVIVVVAGVEGAGKSETVNLLLGWMDARGIQTHAMADVTGEERRQPPMWRYWRVLPPRGRMAIFFGAWDIPAVRDCAAGRIGLPELDRALARMVDFERMLHSENTLLVKFWLHLSRAAQRKRLKKLAADPRQRWRVTRREWKAHKDYDKFRAVGEHMLRRTDTAEAPWHVVEGADRRYRSLTVARTLEQALRERLRQARAEQARPAPQPVRLTPPALNVINRLDMTVALGPEEYEKELAEAQGELNRLSRRLRKKGRSLILVFEGPDAAGKGGTIRRLTEAMDARDYRVIATSAPTDEERAHPYLWRFWPHLPGPGRVALYDRSWYGRVLVERVEGFATPDEWQRAYGEINAFEEQLTDAGMVVVKFWLALTPDEQLRRFQDRETTPYKQYKLTLEDWRNRDRWDSYEAVACDMVERTSTETAPWVLVEADNKEWARVKVLKTVVGRLRDALGR